MNNLTTEQIATLASEKYEVKRWAKNHPDMVFYDGFIAGHSSRDEEVKLLRNALSSICGNAELLNGPSKTINAIRLIANRALDATIHNKQ